MKTNKLSKLGLTVMSLTLLLSSCGKTKVPDVTAGEDTVISNMKTKIEDVKDVKQIVFASLGKLNSYKTYSKSSTNHIVAAGGLNKQDSTSTMYKNGDEYYSYSYSKSTWASVEHEALYKNNKVAYRNKKGEIKNATLEDYLAVYGVSPSKLLSGQIFNQDTILYGELASKNNDGTYTYRLVLDKQKANAALIYQTKAFGGLKSYPEFSDNTQFSLTVKSDYTPISYSYTAKYKVNVAILGNTSVSEDCSATFSNFNEAVTIPDSDKFNTAINETPTKVDIIDGDIDGDNENVSILVQALINSDFKNGVALSGNLKINDYQLPLKLKFKADLAKLLLGKNVKDLIDASLTISAVKGEINVLYHESNLYIDLFGYKVLFALPIKESETTPSGSFDIATIFDYVDVSVVEGKVNTYRIALKDEGVKFLSNLLSSVNIINSTDTISLSADIYVTNNHIAGIYVNSYINNVYACGTDFMYQDELFTLPDLKEYVSEISFSSGLSLDAGVLSGKTSLSGNAFDFSIKYNTLEINILDALEMNGTIKVSDNAGLSLYIKAMAARDDVPFIVPALYASKVYVSLKGGILSFTIYDVTANEDESETKNIKYYQEINLKPTLKNVLNKKAKLNAYSDEASLFGSTSILSLIKFDVLDESIVISLDKDFVNQTINTLQGYGAITDFLIDNGGSVAASTLSSFGFDYPLETIALNIPFNGSYPSLVVTAYQIPTTAKFTYTEETLSQFNIITLINLSLKDYEAQSTDFDFDTIRANQNVANELVETYNALSSNYEISDDYKAKVEALDNQYQALDSATKLMVDTLLKSAGKPTSLHKTYTTKLSNVDDFMSKCSDVSSNLSKLNTYYKAFDDVQIAYINNLDSSLIPNYIAKRQELELEKFNKNVVAKVQVFVYKDVDSLSDDEFLTYLKNMKTLYNTSCSYVNENEDVTTFRNTFAELMAKYIDKFTVKFNKLADELYNFEVSDQYSLEELTSYITLIASINYNYNTSINTGNTAFINFTSQDKVDAFLLSIAKVNYYGTHAFGGYMKSVLLSSNRIVEDILDGDYDTETKKSMAEEFNTFIGKFYSKLKNYVSRYDELYETHIKPYEKTDDDDEDWF